MAGPDHILFYAVAFVWLVLALGYGVHAVLAPRPGGDIDQLSRRVVRIVAAGFSIYMVGRILIGHLAQQAAAGVAS